MFDAAVKFIVSPMSSIAFMLGLMQVVLLFILRLAMAHAVC